MSVDLSNPNKTTAVAIHALLMNLNGSFGEAKKVAVLVIEEMQVRAGYLEYWRLENIKRELKSL